jgi:TatA/E family protein of Tat protein translocase
MFGVESKELLIILFAVLILFGPKRIPEVARALGKGVGDIRDALSGIERDVRHAADSMTAPETRPVPGIGALPASSPSGSSDEATRANGAASAAGANPASTASSGSDALEGGVVATPKPAPGPGPGLAG